ncbi:MULTISPECIES: LacI family DNA-binding transcriptional regulator [Cryobacterium]|uniref:LacI family transcriptional regulator n=1 Tax=Cryobacterium glucosi TaxID=1259175 RepID=A0ABY2IM05_9MICO|nr:MULTISPECIES: LacI family DNA-binding transcriptional regulator [Cryobacterium]TFC07146.1 LacI family transcriptional regulator [Cryobacterium sp. MDB2-33-2]TFC18712.1 LacI family transcriptional regulator [Cryobacterium glucosi]
MTIINDSGASLTATIRDVAAAAGVSVSTVSKALSDGYRVNPETRARVKEIAKSLHFTPNRQAQSLHSGRTGTVGLLTSDLDGRFSIPVMMGAEDAFGLGEVSVFLCDARGDSIREQHHVRALLSRRVDGLIIVGDSTNPRDPLSLALPIPVVYAYAPSSSPDDISVISDNVGAGRQAAEHLISSQRDRIGYIAGDPTFRAATDRVAGATASLVAQELEFVGGSALYGGWTEEWGRNAVRHLLSVDSLMDGVLCGNDAIARGVVDALREDGYDVPRAISVLGHDNWELIATQARPPLSTIDMNLEELGRNAARLLFRAIDGDRAIGTHEVKTRLIHRGSTSPKY